MSSKCLEISVTLFFITLNIISKETITITADILETVKNHEGSLGNIEKFKDNVRITTNGIMVTSKFAQRENKNNTDLFKIYDTVKVEKPDEGIAITAERIDIIAGKDDITISDNIYCKRDDIVFTSDVCEYNLKTNVVKYSSGGQFIKTSGNITVRSLHGEADLKTTDFILFDAVEVSTEDFLIHCDKIEYKKSDDVLTATGSIKIDIKKHKDDFITTSEQLVYKPTGKTLVVNKGLYHAPTYLLAANTLLYNQFHEQLFLNDGFEMILKNQLRFTCDMASYDIKQRHGEIYGNTVLYDMNSTAQRYLYLCADRFSFDFTTYKDSNEDFNNDDLDTMQLDSFTIEEVNDDITTSLPQENIKEKPPTTAVVQNITDNKDTIVIEGKGNVQFCSNSLQGCSDTIKFVNNKILLPNKTIIWNDTNMLIGEDVRMILSDGNISKVNILKDPLFVNADNLGFYNQVSADMMTANVKNNNISKALFKANVDTFYFVVREKKLTGVNRLRCSRFLLLFDKEKLKKIYFNDKIYGNFYFPDYASKNKAKLLLDRFLAEGDLIKATTAPDVKTISSKVKTISLISDKDKKEFFKDSSKSI